jgi:hypothetical protein
VAAICRADKRKGYTMREWIVQRPATIWIQATVRADSLWDALEVWEKQFADGLTEEKDFEIDFDRYWAMDDTGREFDTAGEGDTIA